MEGLSAPPAASQMHCRPIQKDLEQVVNEHKTLAQVEKRRASVHIGARQIDQLFSMDPQFENKSCNGKHVQWSYVVMEFEIEGNAPLDGGF